MMHSNISKVIESPHIIYYLFLYTIQIGFVYRLLSS